MEIFIKFLIAHFAVDFAMQWSAMLADKQRRRFLSPYLYVHGAMHGVMTLLIVMDLSYVYGVLIIAVTHSVIDGLKLTFQTRENGRLLFFLDQLAHLAILAAVAHYYQPIDLLPIAQSKPFYAHLLFMVYLTFPTSIIIQVIFLKWELPASVAASLEGAGSYIGIIERLIVYGAVVTLNWNLIGFMLAAKSIFRFGDLREAHDRKYTEYVFVGTLLSFISAIACGVLYMLYMGQPLISGG
ncbi:MAG: DUF3307 domain-containing protein [Candidatus Thiodiazotropha sp.]